jgi:subtilase family serine protease
LQVGTNERISPPSDTAFSGTSAACPVAAGFIATIMQEHREWDWRTLRKYLQTSMLTQNTTRNFHQGKESRFANDSNWAEVESLEGGKSRIIYNPQTNF